MTSFKRQLLFRLLLVQGLEYYSDKKTAIRHASMSLNQIETLIQVYKTLYHAWDVYCNAQMNQEGPWLETSIFTSNEMMISPIFDEKVKVNFWIHYSLEGGLDTLHAKATQGEHHFNVIQPILVSEWNKLFYHHNDVKPETMEKLFIEGIIKYLRGAKIKSNFDIEVELLTDAKRNTLSDFLLQSKPYAVDDVAYIVDGDKVNVFSDPYGQEDQEEWGRLWDMNAKYRKLIEQGCTPEMAFHLVIID
jgi:hypothetical protein